MVTTLSVYYSFTGWLQTGSIYDVTSKMENDPEST